MHILGLIGSLIDRQSHKTLFRIHSPKPEIAILLKNTNLIRMHELCDYSNQISYAVIRPAASS